MPKKAAVRALALLLALSTLLSYSWAATPKARFVVTAPETSSEVGETLTVDVSIEDNPGFSVVQFTLVYDREALDCTGVRIGEKLQGTLSASNPDNAKRATVAAAAMEPVTGDGTLAQCTFRVKKAHAPLSFELIDMAFGRENGDSIAYTVTGAVQESSGSGGAPADPRARLTRGRPDRRAPRFPMW